MLNELILDDTLVMREIYYRFAGLALSDEMKKEFTPEEVAFMEAQISMFLYMIISGVGIRILKTMRNEKNMVMIMPT